MNTTIMKLCKIIMAAGFILVPYSGEADMEEMTNDSLKQVESDSLKPAASNLSESAFPDHYSEEKIAEKSEFSKFESEIQSFRKSRCYIKFLFLLNKLEKISKKQNYGEIVDSADFLTLCSNIASISRHCRKNLTVLEGAVENDRIKELVRAYCKLFMKINTFYQRVSDQQSGKEDLPDLKELIAEIRLGQNSFETEYNKLRNSQY